MIRAQAAPSIAPGTRETSDAPSCPARWPTQRFSPALIDGGVDPGSNDDLDPPTWRLEGGIETILVALDFSATADGALRPAATLALRHDARLVVLHAVEWLETWWSPMKFSSDFRKKIEAEGRTKLEDALARCDAEPPRVDLEIGFGRAPRVIDAVVRRTSSDLVVLGTRGLHTTAELLLGSTTQRVLESSEAPILTVPDSEAPVSDPPRRILVPTGLSLDFESPMSSALTLAGPRGRRDVEFTLLHCVELPSRYELPVGSWSDVVAGAIATVSEHIEEGAEQARRDQLNVETIVRSGRPAEAILEIARDRRVDLIALNRHGSEPKPKLHLGDTTKRVVRHATCPVLVLPITSAATLTTQE